MRPTSTIFVLLLLTQSAFACQKISDENWPAWRGPTMNGHAAKTANPPIEFGEENRVKWKAPIPGLGNSTPCVWGNKVILTSAKPAGEKGAAGTNGPNELQQLLVIAYDIQTGDVVWQTEVAQAVPHEKGHATSSYASASAVTDGQRVYAFFGSLGLFALDMDGKPLWNREFSKMKTAAGFGEGASPALSGDLLVIPWDEEGQSYLIGIDAKSGEEAWRTERATDSSWTTPLIVNDGERSVIVVSGSKFTRAYELSTGKEIWHCGGMSSNPTASPVAEGDIVFIGNTYKGKVLQAIRFKGASGDLSSTPNLLWTHKKSASYVPTPLIDDDKVYFLLNSTGVLSCLDAQTGDMVFPGKRLGLRNVHASPMLAADRIYVASREGDVAVVDVKNDCNVLAKNHLDDVFDASPVAIGSRLILRGRKSLYCIE